MTAIAFDTLAFANKLKGAGMSATLAEVQAEETAKILNELTIKHLATKQDLKDFQMATQNDLRDLELKMYSFMVKTATFTVGILAGVQTLFHFIK
jgi:hypothetical protein